MKRRLAIWLVYLYWRSSLWMPERAIDWAHEIAGGKGYAAWRLGLARWRRAHGMTSPAKAREIERSLLNQS